MRRFCWLVCLAVCCCAPSRDDGRCLLQPLPLALPAGFPAPSEPHGNPGSDLGRALGRQLFFDPHVSANGRVACANCHEPARAYSSPERLSTRGVSGQPLQRHTPSLLNLAWADSGLFWDGGAKNLESQALGPLLQADELGRASSLPELVRELSADAQYRACFTAVFGPDGVTVPHVARALAQFERSLIAADARWDRAQRGELELAPLEAAGERLFLRHCARCHSPPLFTDRGFHHNGLDATFPRRLEADARGRARITRRVADLGKYKTPSLRQIARSAPYMHDGRFDTLAEVIDHYRRGMRAAPALDAGFLRSDAPPGVPLSDSDARALEAFLKTLE